MKSVFLAALLTVSSVSVAAAMEYAQSPMLDGMDLPAVAERLPSEPMVVTPRGEVGTYGGTWNSGLKGFGDTGYFMRTFAYDSLVRWNLEWNEVVPNVAQSWEASEDSRTYTLKLREGHKWSDGSPFTANDVAWVINDIISDDGFVGSKPQSIFPPDNPVSAEVIDDVTLVITFERPYGLFMQQLAGVESNFLVTYPLAFCGKFHPAHNDEIDDVIAEAEAQSWGEVMLSNCGQLWGSERWSSAEKPTILAWQFEKAYVGGQGEVTMVRNPYYYKVDTAGNQLPYIDRFQMTVHESVEEIVLRASAGEIDFQGRHIASIGNRSVFAQNREGGDYELIPALASESVGTFFTFNEHIDNENLKSVFADKNFRIALSHGIDRDRIIDVVYFGQSEPHQVAPRAADPFYDEEMAKQFTAFDQDTANAMLDDLGLTNRNGDGMRTFADGSPVTFQVSTVQDLRPEWVDTIGLVIEDWRAIGIDARLNIQERTLFDERWKTVNYDALVWQGDGGIGSLFRAEFYVPTSTSASAYGMPYAHAYHSTGSDLTIQPPEAVAKQFDLYRELLSSPDPEVQTKLYKELLAITKDLFPVVGVSTPPDTYFVKKTGFNNVPENMPMSWSYPTPGPAGVEQFYITGE